MNCPNCGNVLVDGAAFCNNCGTPIAPANAAPVAQPVANQGAPAAQPAQPYQQPAQAYQQPTYQQPAYQQPGAPATPGTKSKIAAGILGILLGALGIHKFYLGYTKAGVIMLLIGILGAFLVIGPIVTGIIGIIEGIIYLTKSDQEFYQIYELGEKQWF